MGSRRERRRAEATHASFSPIAVAEVELADRLPTISCTDEDGTRYGAARLVVRLHTKPVGLVDVPFHGSDLAPARYAPAICAQLGPQVNAHLRDDHLPELTRVDETGLAWPDLPRCLDRRRRVLGGDAPLVSVLICTRDRPASLERALGSLEALEYPRFEVIVADGSPSPDTSKLVSTRFPSVRYLHVGTNRKVVGLNRGLAIARGDVTAFTDDDVRADRHWLAELVAGFNDARVACVTGVAFPMELRTPAQLWFDESGAFTEGFAPRLIGLDAEPEPGSLLPYATGKIGAGVNMAWRTSVIRELGGFDVALDTLTPPWPLSAVRGTAGEDVSGFFDALVSGYRIAYNPGAIVYHEHRRTAEELERQLYWHGIGISAHLLRDLATHPALIPGFVARIPRGMAYGFASDSPRNHHKSSRFPRELARAEVRGVVEGPFAYLRGLPEARRIRRAEARRAVAETEAAAVADVGRLP
jgi:GT2 family glycosyltransferase